MSDLLECLDEIKLRDVAERLESIEEDEAFRLAEAVEKLKKQMSEAIDPSAFSNITGQRDFRGRVREDFDESVRQLNRLTNAIEGQVLLERLNEVRGLTAQEILEAGKKKKKQPPVGGSVPAAGVPGQVAPILPAPRPAPNWKEGEVRGTWRYTPTARTSHKWTNDKGEVTYTEPNIGGRPEPQQAPQEPQAPPSPPVTNALGQAIGANTNMPPQVIELQNGNIMLKGPNGSREVNPEELLATGQYAGIGLSQEKMDELVLRGRKRQEQYRPPEKAYSTPDRTVGMERKEVPDSEVKAGDNVLSDQDAIRRGYSVKPGYKVIERPLIVKGGAYVNRSNETRNRLRSPGESEPDKYGKQKRAELAAHATAEPIIDREGKFGGTIRDSKGNLLVTHKTIVPDSDVQSDDKVLSHEDAAEEGYKVPAGHRFVERPLKKIVYDEEGMKMLRSQAGEMADLEMKRLPQDEQAKIFNQRDEAMKIIAADAVREAAMNARLANEGPGYFPDILGFMSNVLGFTYAKGAQWNYEFQKQRGLPPMEAKRIANGIAVADYALGAAITAKNYHKGVTTGKQVGFLGTPFTKASAVPWATVSYLLASPAIVSYTAPGSFMDKMKAGAMTPIWAVKAAFNVVYDTLDKLGIGAVHAPAIIGAHVTKAQAIGRGERLPIIPGPTSRASTALFRKVIPPNTVGVQPTGRPSLGLSREEYAKRAQERKRRHREERAALLRAVGNHGHAGMSIDELRALASQMRHTEAVENADPSVRSLAILLEEQRPGVDSNFSAHDVKMYIKAVRSHEDQDWYTVLLLSAYGQTENLHDSIEAANAAYEQMPHGPEVQEASPEEALGECVSELKPSNDDLREIAEALKNGVCERSSLSGLVEKLKTPREFKIFDTLLEQVKGIKND